MDLKKNNKEPWHSNEPKVLPCFRKKIIMLRFDKSN